MARRSLNKGGSRARSNHQDPGKAQSPHPLRPPLSHPFPHHRSIMPENPHPPQKQLLFLTRPHRDESLPDFKHRIHELLRARGILGPQGQQRRPGVARSHEVLTHRP